MNAESDALVTAAHETRWNVDANMAIWGSDAQRVWTELAERRVIRDGDKLLVTSPSAVDAATHDPVLFSSGPEAQFLGSETGLIPLQIDPPDHVRYRKLLDPLLAPRKVKELESDVVALSNQCIDKFIERGSVDFVSEYAIPLPCGIFLAWLGLPIEGLDDFVKLKESLIRPNATTDEGRNQIRAEAGAQVYALFESALEDRRATPRDDTLGHLVSLEADGTLTKDESLNICYLFLLAGLDTVTVSLECFFAFLATHPDHRRELVNDPSLINSAVEEMFRYESPVPSLSRIATADTVLDGCPVNKGDRMQVLLAASNLISAVPDHPDQVDFHRLENRHVAFGAGVHRCLGSHLARLEMRVSLREWHRRIPEYSLPDGIELQYGVSLREIPNLTLEFPVA